MAENPPTQPMPTPSGDVEHHLTYLKLSFMAQHYAELATQAAHHLWPHVDYLARLVEGEADWRRDRATKSRIRLARFPVIKTLEQFRWAWPTRINRLQVHHQFHLEFIKAKANLIFLGGVGLGKPQPCNYPYRSQCRTGTNHHGHRSPAPAVWTSLHAGRSDAPRRTRPLLCRVAAAPGGTPDPRAGHHPGM